MLPVVFTRLARTLPLLALLACSSNNAERADPVAAARDRNEKKIDTADITERQAADADFLVNATDNALLGVELGKLAQQKATSAVVRTYGTRLVQQRLELLRALQNLAAAKQLAVPADLGQDAAAAYHEVDSQTGTELDKRLLRNRTKMPSTTCRRTPTTATSAAWPPSTARRCASNWPPPKKCRMRLRTCPNRAGQRRQGRFLLPCFTSPLRQTTEVSKLNRSRFRSRLNC